MDSEFGFYMVYLYPCGFTMGSLVSSHLQNHASRWICISKLPLGMNEGVNVYSHGVLQWTGDSFLCPVFPDKEKLKMIE